MRIFAAILFAVTLMMSVQLAPAQITPTQAAPSVTGRYASIIIDTDSSEIIHARKIDEPRYPASLTKLMTLYLTFEALSHGTLKLDQALPVSRYAASQPPSKLGLRSGGTILVRDAINALIISSANDVSVVIAEAISGNEASFASLMTRRAKELGMSRTTFQNPHGLPNSGHVSTARDMAKLAYALIRDHRTYYPLFAQRQFTYRGHTRKNTNALLGTVDGVDGFKTGYTYASGYNLAISAKRNGRRLVAVVLGGASGASRNQHMRDLIDRGFEVLESRPDSAPSQITVKREPIPEQHKPQVASTAILNLRGSDGQTQTVIQGRPTVTRPQNTVWSLYLGDFPTAAAAQIHLNSLTARAPTLKDYQHVVRAHPSFQARFTGLAYTDAQNLCENFKSAGQDCLMVQQTG